MGLVLRSTELVEKRSMDLQEISGEYMNELEAQNRAIEEVVNQLSLGSEQRSMERISELCSGLVESYYHQTEPRNRMAEITPADSVLDSTSIEYFVAVASRYATNFMHTARKIREGTLQEEILIEEIKNLQQHHAKTQMFDQLLLGLANLAFIEPTEDVNASSQSNVSEEQAVIASQNEIKDGEAEVQVKVEEEIYTTTTETIVTSYRETSAHW